MLLHQYIREIEVLVSRGSSAEALSAIHQLLTGFAVEDVRLNAWCDTAGSQEREAAFTRLASALTGLFVNPEVQISHRSFLTLTKVMPEIAHLFLLSGFGSADHILHALQLRGTRQQGSAWSFADSSDARKYLLCSSVYGQSVDTLIQLVKKEPRAALSSVLGALAVHVTCNPAAQENRNRLIDAIQHASMVVPSDAMLATLHRCWTLCSYATHAERHEVKRHLNQLILNWLQSKQLIRQESQRTLSNTARPTLLVACEVSGGGHVMSRCFEPFLEQLQQRFRVVTLIAEDDLGDQGVAWCDELVKFRWSLEEFAAVLDQIAKIEPDAIYYPCLGMRLWTVICCNLRLAPLQLATLGHPATTHSSHIDYMIGGQQTAGLDSCFSEELIRLRSPGNLYRLNRDQERYPPEIRSRPNPLRIATCANMLKLNSQFLAACGKIAEQAERPVEFHFMPNCVGLRYLVARQQVASVLSERARFRVYPRDRCADYLQHLRDCDLYLSPFPFGGENSTLDALLQGVPAVSLLGPQPHSRLDARVMRASGLPDWLIAESVDDYIRVAVRLINQEEERLAISRELTMSDLEAEFAAERDRYASDFVETIWSLYEQKTRM